MTLKQVQDNSKIMLRDILEVANKKSFLLYPAYGTLLGIVRHNGKFIPWDDDIDIMVNSDIIKPLFEAFQKELPSEYGTEVSWVESSRSTSSIVYRYFDGKKLAIDFFEMINLKDDVKSVKQVFLSIAKRYVRFSNGGGLQMVARFFLSVRSKKHYQDRMERILKKVKSDAKTKRAISIIDDDRSWFNYEEFTNVMPCVFEGIDWIKPKNPESYLRTFYGDWQKKPKDKDIKKAQHYEFK